MSNATPDEARLDALGYVEQTIYANEDNPEPSTWSNADVLELLQEVAERLMLDGEIIAPECGATIDSLVDVGHTHVCCAPQDHGDAHACECGAWFELVPVSPNSGCCPECAPDEYDYSGCRNSFCHCHDAEPDNSDSRLGSSSPTSGTVGPEAR